MADIASSYRLSHYPGPRRAEIPDGAPGTNADIGARHWSAVLLAVTVGAIVYVIIGGAPDR